MNTPGWRTSNAQAAAAALAMIHPSLIPPRRPRTVQYVEITSSAVNGASVMKVNAST